MQWWELKVFIATSVIALVVMALIDIFCRKNYDEEFDDWR